MKRLTLFFTRGVSLKDWVEGGMVHREVALYRRLLEHDWAVDFVTYGDAEDIALGSEYAPGVRILCNRHRVKRYARFLPLLHAPRLLGATVLKTNQTNGAEVAVRASRWWRKPLIGRCGYMWSEFMARLHGPDSRQTQRALRVEEVVFSYAHRIAVTTSQMAESIRGRFPGRADHIRVLPNYVDTEHFRPKPTEPDVDLVFVGRLEKQKNVAALLQAIDEAGARALIIGEGSLGPGLRAEYAHLNGRILWRDRVPNSELPAHLHRAKAFILPSLFEGHPKALIEAMAAGMPVIAGDSPGIREMVRHGETGWLTGTEPHNIADAVRHVLGDEDLRRRMGAQAREFVEKTYALDVMARQELTLLEELTP